MKTRELERGTLEPVSLADVKLYARAQTGTLEDTLLLGMLKAARRQCEDHARMCITPRRWVTTYRMPQITDMGMGLGSSVFDPDGVLKSMRLPRRPIRALVSLEWRYRNADLVPATGQRFDTTDERIFWSTPLTSLHPQWASLEATYEAGFAPLMVPSSGDTSILVPSTTLCDAPDEIKQAVLITATHYYDSRAQGNVATGVPAAAKQLLTSWWQSASIS